MSSVTERAVFELRQDGVHLTEVVPGIDLQRDVLDRMGFQPIINTEPWMHVLCTLGGAWGANKWVQMERNLLADVNELRANKGLPPMVGSHNYFPFVPNVQVDESKKY